MPQVVLHRMREKNEELGSALAAMSGIANIKQKGGAIGLFTRGVVKRVDMNASAIVCALTRFIAPQLEQGE